jgi:GrpB-like predicted nucleotidyltransferase (UPF0157 family)
VANNHDDLVFRAWLKERSVDGKWYAVMKRRLAEEYGYNRDGYTEAKGVFINAFRAKAKAKV